MTNFCIAIKKNWSNLVYKFKQDCKSILSICFYSAIFIALCFLFLGNVEIANKLIDNSFLLISNIEDNCFSHSCFIIINLLVLVYTCVNIANKRIYSKKIIAIIIFIAFVYVYYRYFDATYTFITFWKFPVAYFDFIIACGIVTCVTSLYYEIFSKNHSLNQSIQCGFLCDDPIQNGKEDIFNLDNQIKELINHINQTDTSNGAYSIGIDSQWGNGKTSFLNLLKKQIPNVNYIILEYCPLYSKDASNIQNDLLEVISKALTPNNSSISSIISKYSHALSSHESPTLFRYIYTVLHLYSTVDTNELKEKINRIIRSTHKRIIVIIDDLDRITGNELLETLKVMGKSGNFNDVIFIAAYDKQYVNNALQSVLMHETNGKYNYTDKFFSTEISLPLHPYFKLNNYLSKTLIDKLEHIEVIIPKEEKNCAFQNTSELIKNRLNNIRDVKRFINAFIYDYLNVKDDVVFNDFLLLELIKYSHNKEYQALSQQKYLTNAEFSLELAASDDLLYIISDFDSEKMEEPACYDILLKLFPNQADYKQWYEHRNKRIYCKTSFPFYFYNYEYENLKQSELTRLFELSTVDLYKALESYSMNIPDLETYVLTFDSHLLKTKTNLHNYIICLFFLSSNGSYNCEYYKSNLLESKYVNSVLKSTKFFTDINEYKQWLEDLLFDMFDKMEECVIRYIYTIISRTPNAQFEIIFSIDELYEIANSLFNKKISAIDDNDWNASTVFWLLNSVKQKHDNNGVEKEMQNRFYDSLWKHFEKYSTTILSINSFDYIISLNHHIELTNDSTKNKFVTCMSNSEYDKIESIIKIRNFMKLCKYNNSYDLHFKVDRSEFENIVNSNLDCAEDIILKCEEINKKICELKSDVNPKKIATIDKNTCLNNLRNIRKQISQCEVDFTCFAQYKEDLNRIEKSLYNG